jgi:LysR family hydrogen peroxide-inducible transcriptional activator
MYRDLPFTLRQLQYVAAVAAEGGFGVAAERCAVSQPSLSAQVAKVEERLGVVLFQRTARGVRPTTEGEVLLVRIRELLDRARALDAEARALADPEAAMLRIGVIPTVAPYLVPAAVRALGRDLPRVTVHWIEARTAGVEVALERGELDAGLLATAPTPSGLVDRRLGRDPFVLAAPGERAVPEGLSLEDIPPAELLLLEEGHCLRDQALAACGRGGYASQYRATSLTTLVQMVASGLGFTVLPATAVPVELGRAEVRAWPLATEPGRDLRLVWPEDAPRGPLLERVAAALEGALRDVLRRASS